MFGIPILGAIEDGWRVGPSVALVTSGESGILGWLEGWLYKCASGRVSGFSDGL